jgi:transcriptional regulator with XRE-family HTH domain
MITAAQLRAARALALFDQRALAAVAGLSVPTIQRMEASDGVIRGNVDSLTKLISALETAGVEFIREGAPSPGGGRGVRLRNAAVVAPPVVARRRPARKGNA